jgi:hypothetical protein
MSEARSRTNALHSRYNPQAEAERYIDALNLKKDIRYFILIESGLGYLIPALRRKFADSKIIALHADRDLREQAAVREAGVPAWYPGGGETVQDFLEREIPETGAAAARVIEWRPALAVYGEACLELVSQAVEFIKRADAGQRTAAAFGRRWVQNFFKNLALVSRVMRYRVMDAPVIITGSGPGLEKALPQIRAMRDRALLAAASSSLAALASGGLWPDLVISTDGGSWALTHLYACFRGIRRPPPVLAAALCAALPSQCAALPVLALHDGSLWQNLVLRELGMPSIAAPQRGTVTASALDLAFALSSGGVYLAGMDLSIRDIRTHARPYGFDPLFFGAASRFNPVYSQCFARALGIRQGGSHDIYAAWFKTRLALWPKRIFSLGGNHAIFAKEQNRSPTLRSRRENWGDQLFRETRLAGDAPDRCRRGAAALIGALNDERYAQTINSELGPLLFPGRSGISNRELQKALAEIAGVYGGTGGRQAFLF